MPSGAKKRKQQRKKARRARREPQQNEERTPPTEAHGSAEEMASAPLTGIHSLPYETLLAIFSFLPIPDLARCAAVCERWQEIVTGFTQLWKGKTYRSDRSPRESAKVYAVMRALPPIEEVVVDTGEFCIDVWYPRLFLTVWDIADLSSTTYASLLQLGNLQRLRLQLGECCVARGGLRVATKGMRCLVSLQLECVGKSCERHCQQRQEFRDEAWPLQGNVNPDQLSEVVARLPLLEELRLSFCKLAHLDFLCLCPRLRRLTFCQLRWPDTSQLSNLRHLTRLEVLVLAGCRVDADVLSGTLTSLTRLRTLWLSHTKDVAHLRFLRHCPQVRTLSLYGTIGLEKEAYRELCHVTNLQSLYVRFDVRDFVREVVRPCLPKVKIY